jgi:tetratricopeptide (TPR) repeat protein
MIQCIKCGHQNPAGKFCIKCGAKLSTISAEALAQIEILKKRIESDSLNPKLYFELADLYRENKLDADALLEYQKVVTLDSSNWEAHLKSANLYLALKEYEKAESSFKKTLSIKDQSIDAKKGLFTALEFQNKHDDALKLGKEISEVDSNNTGIRVRLKNIYLQKGRNEDAIEELKNLVKLTPNDPKILEELAELYQKLGRTEESISYYKDLHKAVPDDAQASLTIGRDYCMKREYKQSIEVLSKGLSNMIENDLTFAHLYIAYSYFSLDQIDQAFKEINLVSLLFEDNFSEEDKNLYAEVCWRAAKIEYEKKNLSLARDLISRSVKFAPQNSNYQQTLTTVLDSEQSQRAKSTKKITVIVSAVIAVTILIALAWYLIHGQVQLNFPENEGATIYIDDKPVQGIVEAGPGLLLSPSLFMGTHEVRVTQKGYEDWKSTFSIAFGRTTEIPVKMLPAYGYIKITTEPEGASVYIAGKFVGISPVIPIKAQAIEQQVRVEKKGYLPVSSIVSVSKNDTLFPELMILKDLFTGEWGGEVNGPFLSIARDQFEINYWWEEQFRKTQAHLHISQTDQLLRFTFTIAAPLYMGGLNNFVILGTFSENASGGTSFVSEKPTSGVCTLPAVGNIWFSNTVSAENIKLSGVVSDDQNSLNGNLEYDYECLQSAHNGYSTAKLGHAGRHHILLQWAVKRE